MTVLSTNNIRAGGFLTSEANKTRARTQAVLVSGQTLPVGAILGLIGTGTASSAVKASGANTGNGTMGAVTVSAGAQAGVYKLRVTKAATNAGDFEVIDPQGDVASLGTVAAPYSAGGLAFTLADGSTDFVVGDGFDITVAAGSLKYTQLNTAGANGSQVAAAILFDAVDASSADMPCVVVDRDAEVNVAELVFPNAISDSDKAAAITALKSQGIKFPPTY